MNDVIPFFSDLHIKAIPAVQRLFDEALEPGYNLAKSYSNLVSGLNKAGVAPPPRKHVVQWLAAVKIGMAGRPVFPAAIETPVSPLAPTPGYFDNLPEAALPALMAAWDAIQAAGDDKGSIIVFGGGYKETGGPRRLGTYTVEDAEKTGPLRRLTVIGRAGAPGDKIKEKRNRAFDEKTVEDIVSTIAGEAGLTPAVDPDLAKIVIPYRAQLNESDLHLLTQLGKRFGAMPVMKDGHLIFARKGKGMSISGAALPVVMIGPDDLFGESAWRLRGTARAKYGTIRAHWHDAQEATRKKVEETGDGPAYEIPEIFQSEDEAKAAVEGQRNNQDREEEKLSITVVGKETRQAEAMMMVAGLDRDADGQWSIDSITHVFTGTTSYTNAIEGVRKEAK